MSGPGPARWAPAREQAALDTAAALETLRRLWPDKYMFGHDPGTDPERPWWVTRDGEAGSILRAASPEDLNQQLTARGEGTGR